MSEKITFTEIYGIKLRKELVVVVEFDEFNKEWLAGNWSLNIFGFGNTKEEAIREFKKEFYKEIRRLITEDKKEFYKKIKKIMEG